MFWCSSQNLLMKKKWRPHLQTLDNELCNGRRQCHCPTRTELRAALGKNHVAQHIRWKFQEVCVFAAEDHHEGIPRTSGICAGVRQISLAFPALSSNARRWSALKEGSLILRNGNGATQTCSDTRSRILKAAPFSGILLVLRKGTLMVCSSHL